MKQLLTIILLTITLTSYSQTICATKEVTSNIPAPCSIEGQTTAQEGWLIQVGVYKEFIQPKPMTMCYKFGEYYFYYIYIHFIESTAREAIHYYHNKGFCDAIAVPNPFRPIIYN